MKKKLLWLSAIIVAIIAIYIYAQDAPSSYTQHYGFRMWSEGANPSADSLNANWYDIDSVIYNISSPSMTNVVYENQTADVSAAWSFQSGGGIVFMSTNNNLLNVPFYSSPATASTIPGQLGRNTSGDIRLFFGNAVGTGQWDTVAWKDDIRWNNLLAYSAPVGSFLRSGGTKFSAVSFWGAFTVASTGEATLNDTVTFLRKPFMASTVVRMLNDNFSTDSLGNKVIVTCDYGDDRTILCNIPFESFRFSNYMTIDSIKIYAYADVDGCDLHGYLIANSNTGSYTQVDAASSFPGSTTGNFSYTYSFGYTYTSDLPLVFKMTTTAYEATTLYFYNFVVYASY